MNSLKLSRTHSKLFLKLRTDLLTRLLVITECSTAFCSSIQKIIGYRANHSFVKFVEVKGHQWNRVYNHFRTTFHHNCILLQQRKAPLSPLLPFSLLNNPSAYFATVSLSEIWRDKTMSDKLMYIPNMIIKVNPSGFYIIG